jgi:hypothetical protein
MNSTSDSDLREFYRTRLVPAADSIRARRSDVLPHKSDETNFVAYDNRPEFGVVEADDIADLLRVRWTSRRIPELAELSADIALLAGRLRGEAHGSEDVSPFMYVMY